MNTQLTRRFTFSLYAPDGHAQLEFGPNHYNNHLGEEIVELSSGPGGRFIMRATHFTALARAFLISQGLLPPGEPPDVPPVAIEPQLPFGGISDA